MNNLKQKIKQTVLFTPDEKVDILVAYDTFLDLDVKELESIIDEYDEKYTQILATFRRNMIQELDTIQGKIPSKKLELMKKAVDTIKSGLITVTTTG